MDVFAIPLTIEEIRTIRIALAVRADELWDKDRPLDALKCETIRDRLKAVIQ